MIPNPFELTKKLATSHGKTFGPLSVDNKSDFALPYVSLGNNFLAAQKLPVGQAQRQALSKLLSVSSGDRSATSLWRKAVHARSTIFSSRVTG